MRNRRRRISGRDPYYQHYRVDARWHTERPLVIRSRHQAGLYSLLVCDRENCRRLQATARTGRPERVHSKYLYLLLAMLRFTSKETAERASRLRARVANG